MLQPLSLSLSPPLIFFLFLLHFHLHKEMLKFVFVLQIVGQVPPVGKGSMYIRPLLMGTGSVLGLAPAAEYTFLIYTSPVKSYHKVSLYTLAP